MRLIALALAGTGAGLILLGILTAGQTRSIADALAGRELDTLHGCSRFAARELDYLVSQEEGRFLGWLRLESAEALVGSIAGAEAAAAHGVVALALLSDGSVLYPRDAAARFPPETAGAAGDRERLLRLALDRGKELLERLDGGSVARVCLNRDGERLTASLHRLSLATSTGLLAICWSDAVVQGWCRSLVADVVPAGYALELADADGGSLFRFPPAGAPARSLGAGHACAVLSLPAGLFPWSVRVEPADPLHTQRLVRREIALRIGSLAALGLLIALGVWLLVRVTLREIRLSRLQSDFAANISHELRTPLALIRGAADSLCSRRDLDRAQMERYLGMIRRESQRLTEMVNTVMRFTRMDRREEQPRREPADLGGLAEAVAESYGEYLEAEGFRFHVRLPPEPLYARVDIEAIRLVLVNLLDNAAKFSRDEKDISLAVSARDGQIALSVTDRGIGIAPEDRERIFDLFFRAEGDLVKRTRGAGIGLALVQRIVTAHGGRVEVETAVGKGSTFTVLLPRAEGPPGGWGARGGEARPAVRSASGAKDGGGVAPR